MDSTAELKDRILALEIALRQVLAWSIELQNEAVATALYVDEAESAS